HAITRLIADGRLKSWLNHAFDSSKSFCAAAGYSDACLSLTVAMSTPPSTRTITCSGVRAPGVNRGWPEPGARRTGRRGGPRHGPPHPPRSERPGKPVALLDHPRVAPVDVGGPDMAPHTPHARSAPGNPWRSSTTRASLIHACRM